MNNIRIGTDIKLKLNLYKKLNIILAESGSEIETAPINIKSLKCVIISKEKESTLTKERNAAYKFVSRFPNEPRWGYDPDPYHINTSGLPAYTAYPEAHLVSSYAGYGLNPDWKTIYPPVYKANSAEYVAQVKALSEDGAVEVYFPAEAQRYCGLYRLVVIAKIYDVGYDNNLRTVTMDYDNVFNLVSSSSVADGNIVINIDAVNDESYIPPTSIELISAPDEIRVGQIGTFKIEVKPSEATDKNVEISFSNTCLSLFDHYDDTYVVRADRIISRIGYDDVTVTFTSKADPTVRVTKIVRVHDYALGVGLTDTTIKKEDYDAVLDYGDSATFTLCVHAESGDIVTYYNGTEYINAANGVYYGISNTSAPNTLLPAIQPDSIMEYSDKTDNSVTIKNINDSDSDLILNVRFVSLIADENGKTISRIGKVLLRSKNESVDAKVVSGHLGVTDDGKDADATTNDVVLHLNDGTSVNIDMSREFAWGGDSE